MKGRLPGIGSRMFSGHVPVRKDLRMFHPRTLQQRLLLFMLLPVLSLLIGGGALGFMTMRRILLSQWQEAAIGRLERAAHRVDMKLRQPKDLIQMYHLAAGSPRGRVVQEWLLQQLRNLDGVGDVRITWEENSGEPPGSLTCDPVWEDSGGASAREHHPRFMPCRLDITTPRYDASADCDGVFLHSEFKTPEGTVVGKIEVLPISYTHLTLPTIYSV